MSLSNLLRRRAHPVTVLCRHGSSTAIKSKPRRIPSPATRSQPRRILPDEKLRALVSLYHQADNFITIENLSQRIDKAFTTKQKYTMGYEKSLRSMEEFVEVQRKQPRVAEWNRQHVESSSYPDSSKHVQRKRETKVKQALYGLDEKDGIVPGLEILKDAVANEGDLLKRLESEASEVLKDEK